MPESFGFVFSGFAYNLKLSGCEYLLTRMIHGTCRMTMVSMDAARVLFAYIETPTKIGKGLSALYCDALVHDEPIVHLN